MIDRFNNPQQNIEVESDWRTISYFTTEELVEEINRRTHLYRVFEHVSTNSLDSIANVAFEELRIRALSGRTS